MITATIISARERKAAAPRRWGMEGSRLHHIRHRRLPGITI
jgi:hypothetical protein